MADHQFTARGMQTAHCLIATVHQSIVPVLDLTDHLTVQVAAQ